LFMAGGSIRSQTIQSPKLVAGCSGTPLSDVRIHAWQQP
jgi:hypothetical protein